MSHVMNTYARQPVAFVRGQGVWLWDEAGNLCAIATQTANLRLFATEESRTGATESAQ